jgi:phosphoribosyl 1,2-cyclic phosphodiesterase
MEVDVMTDAERFRRWLGFQLLRLAWWVLDKRTVTMRTFPPGQSPEQRALDLADEALDVGRRILLVHTNVQMDTPEDKNLHARACETFGMALNVVESKISEERSASGRSSAGAHRDDL